MILDNTLRLEAVLAGAVAANQPDYHVDYKAWNNAGVETKPAQSRGALNSTTDVIILAAPTIQGFVFEIERASIYNRDTASVTVTVKTDDGTTERLVCRVTLATLETLCYARGRWFVLTSSGAIKQGAGVSGPASSTDNAAARWDGTTGTVTQNSGVIIDDSNNVSGMGTLNASGLVTALAGVVAGTGNTIRGLVPTRATVDQPLTTQTTLQNATNMAFTMAANEEWIATAEWDVGTILSTTGIKVALDVPAGATMNLGVVINGDTPNAAGASQDWYRKTTADATAVDFTTANLPGTTLANIKCIVWVLNGANAGNAQLQFAQSTSSATALTIIKGSFMDAKRIA